MYLDCQQSIKKCQNSTKNPDPPPGLIRILETDNIHNKAKYKYSGILGKHFFLSNTVVLWANTGVFWANTMEFWANTVAFWANTVVFWANTVVFGGNTVEFSANTVVF